MTDQSITSIIEQASDESIQSRARTRNDSITPSFLWMVRAGALISPWWSPTRDKQLRKFWKSSDHLSGAIYSFEAKMTAIPFQILPRDQSIKEYVKQAEETTEVLMNTAEFGDGWDAFLSKILEDYLTTDNGLFFEIIGDGPKDGPIVGRPTSIAALDSYRCTRSGDPIYPVIYMDTDSKRYKLHYTRVGFRSSMPSPIAEMYAVGFSACSRCINIAQSLVDILTFRGEKMGSRPHRAVLVTKGGLDPSDVANAFAKISDSMDSQGLSRYSKTAVVGSSALPEADLQMLDLASLPDGFDEEKSTTLGMAVIALALGVDARELFPAMQAGASRADALLQHLKQRGKGPGQVIQMIESLFNQKYLPPHLRMVFDFQDDAEDRQVADTKLVRSNRHRTYVSTGVTNKRVAREQMLEDGDLDRSQFERIELEDGRLDDGTTVLALFYADDKDYKKFLSFPGVEDPTDVEANDAETIIPTIKKLIAETNKVIVNHTGSQVYQWKAYQCRAALEHLLKLYQPDPLMEGQENQGEGIAGKKPSQTPQFGVEPPQGLTAGGLPKRDKRSVRNQELTTPNQKAELSTKPDNRPSQTPELQGGKVS